MGVFLSKTRIEHLVLSFLADVGCFEVLFQPVLILNSIDFDYFCIFSLFSSSIWTIKMLFRIKIEKKTYFCLDNNSNTFWVASVELKSIGSLVFIVIAGSLTLVRIFEIGSPSLNFFKCKN